MYVEAIENVKNKLEELKKEQHIKDWELPYENLLTRLNAAAFYFSGPDEASAQELVTYFEDKGFPLVEKNTGKLSELPWQLKIAKDEEEREQMAAASKQTADVS